ncbi:hypothetical protein GGX14DRAFT_503595 [Mycena pura]|uniref:Nucleolar protein 12 n=1 Tax=Mycena pura TaxID=153505 RepID=A0AAD6V352_9AGAR|nr:hypothetical protein GGX14DRAFT_503595 [Mycena pura]
MSLSARLLSNDSKKIDTELDALFKKNPATTIQAPARGSAPPTKKRKIEASVPDPSEGRKNRVKPVKATIPQNSSPKAAKSPAQPTPLKSNQKKTAVEEETSEESGDDDEDKSDLENAYLRRKPPVKPTTLQDSSSDEDEPDGSADQDSNSDTGAPPPVHEALTKRARTKPAKKIKLVPEGETPAQRDARTLFVGGLPVEVAQKKPLQKQLSRHILSFLPPASTVKIESMRFRSLAFRDPSSSTTLSSASPASNANSNSIPLPGASSHSKERASTWRQAGGASDHAEGKEDEKKAFLTPAQKKKVMFIQRAFHPEASSVNAYLVLAHHTMDADAAADSPYAAALHIARAANLVPFMERALRVDACARLPAAGEADADANANVTGAVGDPKFSIFVGNLEFGSREDDVREFFEGVVAGERGPAPAAADEGSDGGGGRWVQGVRLVRDRETQLGKGFGYVRFVDRECVDEILALTKTEEGKKKLRFAKRALRVQRCRVVGVSSKPAVAATPVDASKSTYPTKRGDPTLGDRLVHLGKDERKAVKKADSERQDRRAEKKKLKLMRMRMGVVKNKPSGAGGKRVAKGNTGKGKDRERVRKARVSGSKGRK